MTEKNYDVVIVGGGTAGVAAAYELQKDKSLKICILEKNIYLGGTQTGAQVNPYMPSLIKGGNDRKEESVMHQMQEEVSKTNIQFGTNFSPALLKIGYDQLLSNVDILYDCSIVNVNVSDSRINSVTYQWHGEKYELVAKNFIDASGDAILSRLAGVPLQDTKKRLQPISIRFEMAGIDVKRVEKLIYDNGGDPYELPTLHFAWTSDKKWPLDPYFKKGIIDNLLPSDFAYFQAFGIPKQDSSLAFNCPEVKVDSFSPIDVSKGVSRAYARIKVLSEFLVKSVPGFEKAYVSSIAPMIGVRNSHQIVGEYKLTVDDVVNKKKFEDGISKTNWYMDIHGAPDEERERLEELLKKNKDDYYEIPFRSLFNKGFKNLLVVGRCISSDMESQSSYRVQHVMQDMGEAAAIAVKKAISKNIDLVDVDGKEIKKEMKI